MSASRKTAHLLSQLRSTAKAAAVNAKPTLLHHPLHPIAPSCTQLSHSRAQCGSSPLHPAPATRRHLSSVKPKGPPPYIPTTKNGKRMHIIVDDRYVSYDNIFLRDACTCPLCVDPSTQQKLFQTTDIPYEVHPRSSQRLPGGGLKVVWEDDIPGERWKDHESVFEIDFLRRYSSLRSRIRASYNDQTYVLWDRNKMENDQFWIDYEEYMNSDEKLFLTLKHLSRYGLIFVKNIPPGKSDAVNGLAGRIGNLKNTFYGETWDVESVQDSKNIAYTSLDLGLHMDLLYFESPPGIQFLHSIKNSTTGGSSYFADTFRAATSVRLNSQMLWKSLLTFPITYHYKNDNQHYHFTHPTVVVDEHSYVSWEHQRISHVNWAPPFQAPFEIDVGADTNPHFRTWINAAKQFAVGLEGRDNQFELRLEEGVCVVFMNRRIVHARRAFDPTSGDRWLKGTYVDGDAFMSKLRVLSEKFKGGWEGLEKKDDEYLFIR
ncbi:hypothetical protein RUND412_008616 [Rhizina undulata]